MRILGIDPGFAITGYSVIEYIGNKFKLITAGAIETKAGTPFPERLAKIYDDLNNIIEEYNPEAMSIEELFFNNNIKTGIKVAEARGIVVLVGHKRNLPIFEYTPLQVKQAVVGYGRAEKKQVQKMVQSILKVDKIPKLDDITDSMAIAICHAHSCRFAQKL